jgi:hypothetical protein
MEEFTYITENPIHKEKIKNERAYECVNISQNYEITI